MKGFPKYEVIKHLEEAHLNISRSLIDDIEYISFESFIKLLKGNNIKIAKYKKYWSRIKPNGSLMEKL